MQREWKDAAANTFYYYKKYNGLIVGQIYNLAHTQIWGAKIPISPNEELLLGHYINSDFARHAVEEYWDEKDRTIEITSENLLSRL
jgi:hypothetical protein